MLSHVCHVSTTFVCSLTQFTNSVTFVKFLFLTLNLIETQNAATC